MDHDLNQKNEAEVRSAQAELDAMSRKTTSPERKLSDEERNFSERREGFRDRLTKIQNTIKEDGHKLLEKYKADWSEFKDDLKKNYAKNPGDRDTRTSLQLARLDGLNAKVSYFSTAIAREESPDQQELASRIEPLRDHYRQLKAQLHATYDRLEEFPEKQREEFDRGLENYAAEVEEFQKMFFQSGPDSIAVPNRESLIETFPPRG